MIRLFCVLFAAFCSQSDSAESPSDLLQRMYRKAESSKSCYMIQKQTVRSPMFEISTTSTAWYAFDGSGTYRFRVEGLGQLKQSQNKPTTIKNLAVSDGKAMYVQTAQLGMRSVVKQHAPTREQDLKTLLKTIRSGDAKIKGVESIEGRNCIVLQVVSGQADQKSTTTYWFSEELGHPLKTVTEGKQLGYSEILVTEIKCGLPIDPKKFEYQVPPGVQVQDMTQKHDGQ